MPKETFTVLEKNSLDWLVSSFEKKRY